MTNVVLQVQGMSCNHCVNSIEKALNEIGAKGSVSLSQGTVAVEYEEGKLSLEAVKEAIEEQGYDIVG